MNCIRSLCSVAAATAAFAFAAAPTHAQQQLCTLFAGGNGLTATGTGDPINDGAGNMFDLTSSADIIIQSIDGVLDDANGGAVSCDIYITPTTYVGNELNAAAWTLVGSGTGTAAGPNAPTRITLNSVIPLQTGSYGVFVYYVTAAGGVDYTTGTGTNETYSDSILSFTAGNGLGARFSGGINSIRVWNGCINYVPANGLFPSFSADRRTAGPGETVNFTDTSFTSDPNGIIVAEWDFDGDGVIDAVGSTVSYTYPSGSCGPQDVRLTVTDATFGSMSRTETGYIDILAPETSFTADVTFGINPVIVQLTDTSINQPSSWAWDFESDGTIDSTMQNPLTAYATSGVFTVSLTTTNSCGMGTTATASITVVDGLPGLLPSNVELSGSGCPATAAMGLDVSGSPTDGSVFNLDLDNVPAGAVAGSVLIGAQSIDLPLDLLGATGCSLLVNPFTNVNAALTVPTGTASIGPVAMGTAVNLAGAQLQFQAAVIAPGVNPGSLATSNRASVTIGSDVSGFVDPSMAPGIVIAMEGTNTFFTAPRAQPFFNVYNNSTTAENILSVTFDFFNGGPLVADGISVFDIDGLTAASGGKFDEGNAALIDPSCPANTYRGTDVSNGLDYNGTAAAVCDPLMVGTTTGWIGSNFDAVGNPATVQFNFSAFAAGNAFTFDADIDGGPIGSNGLNQCRVSIQTDQRFISGTLVILDNDTAIQAW